VDGGVRLMILVYDIWMDGPAWADNSRVGR